MTTSTIETFNETQNQIITNALNLIGIMGADDSLSANDYTLCSQFLNMLIKSWEGLGIHIWTNTYATVYLANNQASYNLGNASTDAMWANTVVETTLSQSLAASATAVTVVSTTGMTVGDNIGIVSDASTIYWTTIATIPSSTTLTLTAGDSEDTFSSGAYVYTFTTKPSRPLRVLQCARRSLQGASKLDIMMPSISFSDYQLLSNKTFNAEPLQYKYDAQLVSGKLTLWPVPTLMTDRLHLHYTRPLYDFNQGTDTGDIPQEWLLCTVYNLAVLIAPAYGKTGSVAALQPMAAQMLHEMNSYDQENVSFYFNPSKDRY